MLVDATERVRGFPFLSFNKEPFIALQSIAGATVYSNGYTDSSHIIIIAIIVYDIHVWLLFAFTFTLFCLKYYCLMSGLVYYKVNYMFWQLTNKYIMHLNKAMYAYYGFKGARLRLGSIYGMITNAPHLFSKLMHGLNSRFCSWEVLLSFSTSCNKWSGSFGTTWLI